MTSLLSAPLAADVGGDPHAAKMAPGDPRLAVRRATSRTLRTAPVVALVGSVMGAGTLALAFAFAPSSSAGAVRAAAGSSAPPGPPVIPDSIRNAAAAKPGALAVLRDAGAAPALGRAPAAQGPTERTRRADEELSAKSAGILFETGASASGIATEPPGAHLPSAAQGPVPGSGSAPASPESDPNQQERKNAFLGGPDSRAATALTARLEPPRSPYALLAGTIIPAVLMTAINSDLPGPVIAQVRESVYDTVTGNTLLVPQGSRLLAHYDSMVMWGQERVLLCWNRLILPSGDSIRLQCMPAADLQGAAGLTDQVDEHWFRLIKGAAIASLLAASTQAVAGNTEGYNPTVPQVWARNAAGNVNQVGQSITARDLSIQPTITIRPGYSVNVVVTQDIVLAPYREPGAVLGLRP